MILITSQLNQQTGHVQLQLSFVLAASDQPSDAVPLYLQPLHRLQLHPQPLSSTISHQIIRSFHFNSIIYSTN
jgi:hypothetical protein